MTTGTQPLLLFDLLNTKNALLLREFDTRWTAANEIILTGSEWLILSKVLENSCSIAQVAKSVPITRQATHKCIKSLEAKNLISTSFSSENRRVKLVTATLQGKEFFERGILIKREIENELLQLLGNDKLVDLKILLNTISPTE